MHEKVCLFVPVCHSVSEALKHFPASTHCVKFENPSLVHLHVTSMTIQNSFITVRLSERYGTNYSRREDLICRVTLPGCIVGLLLMYFRILRVKCVHVSRLRATSFYISILFHCGSECLCSTVFYLFFWPHLGVCEPDVTHAASYQNHITLTHY